MQYDRDSGDTFVGSSINGRITCREGLKAYNHAKGLRRFTAVNRGAVLECSNQELHGSIHT